ncbi:MAG: hypothetical protein PHD32_11865, partial [Eubacteriales bacterium]|nr:hypothetical protein [Eubacteriales bacterium]
MKKISAQLAVTMLGIAISYFGAALAAVANIGQGPVSAFCLTLSRLTGLPFGTALTLFQGVFVVGQIALLRKKFPLTRLLQVVTILFGGLVVNFFVYYVFKDAVISSYWLRLALDVLACAVNAAGVSLTLAAALVGVPLE